MKKSINVYLNVSELVSLLLLIGCFLLSYRIDVIGKTIFDIQNTNIIKNIILYSSFLFEFIIVSVELFLFINYKLKFRFIYILYLIIDLVFIFCVNEYFPFFGVVVALAFCIIKFILRLCFIKALYIPDEVYNYFELYNIPIKREKRKVSKNSGKKILTNKVKAKEKEKKSVTKTVTRKKKKAVTA